MVNCAGVNRGYNTLLESEYGDFDFNFKVNTMGVVFGIKHATPHMPTGGSIVNVASAAGMQGGPYLAPYVSSKWAMLGITRTAALELGEQKAVPLGRIAEPEEVAAIIHFLSAPDCVFVNGQTIGVDGGFAVGMSMNAYNCLAES